MHSTPNSVDIPVVHYPTSVYPRDQGNLLCTVLSELSINMPVLSCLFHSSLKQTPDIRSSPYPPTRRDGSPLCLNYCSFLTTGSPDSSHIISQPGAFVEWGLPVRIYYYSLVWYIPNQNNCCNFISSGATLKGAMSRGFRRLLV